MFGRRFLTSVFMLLITRQSFAKRMSEENSPQLPAVSIPKYSVGKEKGIISVTTSPVVAATPKLASREKRTIALFAVASSPTRINFAATQKSVNLISGGNGTTANSMMSSEDAVASSTRDTIVVLITLTIIFFTLIATYFLWRKHRSSMSASHSVYMYSRLSQNDVEVDNISFQGDLTHKSLINTVPVCAEEDSCDDDQVRPATLCLEYDSLVTISNEDNNGHERQRKRSTSSRRHSSSAADDTPVNLLIDDLSDEQDLLQ